jgi:hypothetical protein
VTLGRAGIAHRLIKTNGGRPRAATKTDENMVAGRLGCDLDTFWCWTFVHYEPTSVRKGGDGRPVKAYPLRTRRHHMP